MQGMMYGYRYGIIWIVWLVFWILVIIGIALLIKYLSRDAGKKEESALEILKKRYARGEISKEEFEERMKGIA